MSDHKKVSPRSGSALVASFVADAVLSPDILDEYNQIVHEAETLAFITRDSDLQKAALERLGEFLQKAAEQKVVHAVRGNENAANAILALQCLISSLRAEISMWIALKEDDHEGAWDFLISAQSFSQSAIRAHPCGGTALDRMRRYEDIEALVFPPQVFQSSGFVIREASCSICTRDYEDCEHVKGRAYLGEFCSVVVKQADLLEVSFVPEPKDKRCRVTRFGESGKWRNRMTWRLEDPEDPGNPPADMTIEGCALRFTPDQPEPLNLAVRPAILRKMPTEPASPALASESDLDFEDLLGKTSRTFALSIPHLPEPTRREVTLAYLLFRIADTFEDAATWPRERRREALEQFGRLLEAPAPEQAERLAALWSETVPCAQPGYRELLVRLPAVLDATYSLGAEASELVRAYALRTVLGMAEFVDRMTDRGELVLADLADLRQYCYVVAGLVGELLTELLLLDRPELHSVAEDLRAWSRDFGEGLQLVNILKDAAGDAIEGRTYLPPDVPRDEVFALARRDLGLAGEYVRTIQLAGAARGVVAFNALPARLALASLDRREEKGPGAKVTRPELFKIISRLEKALDAGEPPVPAPDAHELAEISASIWPG